MNRRTLHLDLLHSGKYRQHIVKVKKGKGAFSRHEKHKKHHRDAGGVFLCLLLSCAAKAVKRRSCRVRAKQRQYQPVRRTRWGGKVFVVYEGPLPCLWRG